VTPLRARIAFLVLGLTWLILGAWSLAEGDIGHGVAQLALGVGWLLLSFFGDRFHAWLDATRERQRSRVEGFGAMSFLPDRDEADTP
jgi:hypothetical protein